MKFHDHRFKSDDQVALFEVPEFMNEGKVGVHKYLVGYAKMHDKIRKADHLLWDPSIQRLTLFFRFKKMECADLELLIRHSNEGKPFRVETAKTRIIYYSCHDHKDTLRDILLAIDDQQMKNTYANHATKEGCS